MTSVAKAYGEADSAVKASDARSILGALAAMERRRSAVFHSDRGATEPDRSWDTPGPAG